MAHPDRAVEQAHLDRARAALRAMRGRTLGALDVAESAATEVDSAVARGVLSHRLASIDDETANLCFGRIDEADGDRWHVGRRHVEDQVGDALVVDWRAPVSTAFYRATVADPQGLDRRRRFILDDAELVDILEEDFTDPDGAVVAGGIPDPLLAELERSRGPEMRDIVATIAAEQDEVIRAPLDRCLVVQGGPGTGKTAVALHRAAFLLYEHRSTLQERRVLVLGPNPIFLRYVAGVLPSLGETAVLQTTIEGLVAARWPVTRQEPDEVARIKGDARMATLLDRLVDDRVRRPTEPLVLSGPWGRVRLAPTEVGAVIDEVRARRVPHSVGREALRNQLLHLAYDVHQRTARTPALKARFLADTRSDPSFSRAIGRIWPTQGPVDLVQRALGNRATLRRCATDLLADREVEALLRAKDLGWSIAEIPLLDEADARCTGVRATYGHVVVDESQDLSAMALRMAARRAPGGSMTIVGDLAQATAPWALGSWKEVIDVVSPAVAAEVTELTVGYRVPGPILDLANRLLPVAAPDAPAARSVRPTGDPPADVVVDPPRLAQAAVRKALALADRFGSIAVIAAAASHPALAGALDAARAPWADAARAGLGAPIALLDPVAAKGLEFDAVVVVEPAEIAEDGERGLQALFVAMTRAVQHLSLVRARALPAPLGSEVA